MSSTRGSSTVRGLRLTKRRTSSGGAPRARPPGGTPARTRCGSRGPMLAGATDRDRCCTELRCGRAARTRGWCRRPGRRWVGRPSGSPRAPGAAPPGGPGSPHLSTRRRRHLRGVDRHRSPGARSTRLDSHGLPDGRERVGRPNRCSLLCPGWQPGGLPVANRVWVLSAAGVRPTAIAETARGPAQEGHTHPARPALLR